MSHDEMPKYEKLKSLLRGEQSTYESSDESDDNSKMADRKVNPVMLNRYKSLTQIK